MTRRRSLAWAALVPVALTVAVYLPAVRFPFVSLDDPYYVVHNADLRQAPPAAVVRYAFTTFTGGNWHPLVWLSFGFDRWAWHLSPGPMHAENVALHAAAGVLVLLLLADATGSVGRATVCAAVFAVHPLHVESVAWISERKDVLSTAWLLAAACAFVRFARTGRPAWYGAVLACYGLSLSAKSMGVTLPGVLLLLDAWPLRRLRGAVGRRVLEQVPLLAMAAAASAAAVAAQASVGATHALATTAGDRAGNAAVSAVRYLGDLFWPADLAVFYPFRPVPTAAAVVSVAVLAAVTGVAGRLRHARPYLLVGWLWFAGTLVPVIGLVQVGMQARADRYVYFPSVGLSVAVVWLAADVLGRAGPTAAAGVILAATVVAHRQVTYWRDDRTLFAHAVAVTDDNYFALNYLADDAVRRGDVPAAVRYLNRSLDARDDYAPTYAALGGYALQAGRAAEAASALREAVRLAPADPAYRRLLAEAVRDQAAEPAGRVPRP